VEHVHLDLGSPPSFYSSDRTVTWALLLQVGDAGRSVRFTLSAP
jgi:hypothetical protein